MEFHRQEYLSGLLYPPPGNLSDPGIKTTSLMSPALAGMFFTTRATWEALLRSRDLWVITFDKGGCKKQKPLRILLGDQILLKLASELFFLNAWFGKNPFCL